MLGAALEAMGAQDGALGLYGAMLQTWPRHPGVLRARAELLLQTENLDQVIPDLTALTELQPRDGWAFAMRGSVYASKGDLGRAEADVRKAVAVDADPGQWMIVLARLQAGTGRAADARATIDKALDFQTGCLKSNYDEFQTAYAKFQQDVKTDYARAAQSWAALDVDCPSDPAACEAARSRGKASKAKLDAEIAAMPKEVKAKYDAWLTGDNVRAKAQRSRAAFLEKPGEYDYKGSWNYEMERSVAGFTGG
jgi:tetratricopeptide (TPR) repeat protein